MSARILTTLAVALGLAGSPSRVAAATWVVPGDSPSIGGAVVAAAAGDTIRVGAGDWSTPDDRNIDFSGRAIVLIADAGPTLTTIDAGGAARAFEFHSDESRDAVVDGFRITGGAAEWGGAVRIANASPTFRNCVFAGNSATSGGAVHVTGFDSPAFFDCVFDSNVAALDGGALAAGGSPIEIGGSQFVRNDARHGGAIHLGPWAEGRVDSCWFEGNRAEAGGGIFATAWEEGIAQSGFVANEAASGSAMYLQESTASIRECTFAAYSTEAVHCFGGEPAFERTILLAPPALPAVTRAFGAVPTFVACIAWGPDGGGDVGGATDVLVVDPLLCAPASGDVGLCADSPALAAGNSWGVRIGALQPGCSACGTPVHGASWGRVKARWRPVW